jgi:hypothetical protein
MSGNLTPNYFAPASPNNWIYNRFRLPKLPPVEDTVSQPGHLCWGSVGALPTAQPVATTSFQVVGAETHNEINRQSKSVRIENPDDPEQHIWVDVASGLLFEKVTAKPASNTHEEIPPGVSDYENLATNFVPEEDGTKTTLRVNFHGPGNV